MLHLMCESRIVVGDENWHELVQCVDMFSFTAPNGTYCTVKQKGDNKWYASRGLANNEVLLGASSDLTQAQLAAACKTLDESVRAQRYRA